MVQIALVNYIFLSFMQAQIDEIRALGRQRTAETYATALRSFARFLKGTDLLLDHFVPEVMMAYEAYLQSCGVCRNTSSFYMRNLRAVYNRAVWQGLTLQRHPFKYVYTGVEATLKRAIPIQDIQRLKQTDLSSRCKLAFARDMFLFSFYTRGMSFVDMAYLRKCDLCGTYLTYKRRKTGQTLHIKWENGREIRHTIFPLSIAHHKTRCNDRCAQAIPLCEPKHQPSSKAVR